MTKDQYFSTLENDREWAVWPFAMELAEAHCAERRARNFSPASVVEEVAGIHRRRR